MKSSLLMNFSVDKENRKINIEREFAAPKSKVWAAWTESKILDEWWAPKPYKTKTKTMKFEDGGYWLYAMVGPDGSEHWCRIDFKDIIPLQSYSAQDAFCDEHGNLNDAFPTSYWFNKFNEVSGSTIVKIEIQYEKQEDLEKIVEMGFKEGLTSTMENLDEMLS